MSKTTKKHIMGEDFMYLAYLAVMVSVLAFVAISAGH